ncbi:MAG: phosphatidate cytidylyltransferase [Bacteroidota bacterium]
MSNLLVRVLVAVIGIPVIVALTMAGGWWFVIFVAIVSSLALREYYLLAGAKSVIPQAGMGIVFGLFVTLTFFHGRLQLLLLEFLHAHGMSAPLPTMAQTFLILFLVFVPVVFLYELFRNKPGALTNSAVTLAGVSYVSLFLGSLVGLRELFIPGDFPIYAYFPVYGPNVPEEIVATVYRWGGFTVLTVFAAIWVCDSAAYFAGKAWGKHKLFPRVSPNKSWEGAVAGFCAAVLVFLGARSLVLPYLTLENALICGIIVGVFGQLGDLAESLLKRDAGVKDSSNLIPGHGGVLDRFDSLLFVSPLIFLYLDFIVF